MSSIRQNLNKINDKRHRLEELKMILAKELESSEDIAIASYAGLVAFGHNVNVNIIITRSQLIHAIECEIDVLSKNIKFDADQLLEQVGELANGI